MQEEALPPYSSTHIKSASGEQHYNTKSGDVVRHFAQEDATTSTLLHNLLRSYAESVSQSNNHLATLQQFLHLNAGGEPNNNVLQQLLQPKPGQMADDERVGSLLMGEHFGSIDAGLEVLSSNKDDANFLHLPKPFPELLPHDAISPFMNSSTGSFAIEGTPGIQAPLSGEDAADIFRLLQPLPEPHDVISLFTENGATSPFGIEDTNMNIEDIWGPMVGIQAPLSEEAATFSLMQQHLLSHAEGAMAEPTGVAEDMASDSTELENFINWDF
jgi:hypothetical protein